MMKLTSHIIHVSPRQTANPKHIAEAIGASIVTNVMIQTAFGSNPINADDHHTRGAISSQYNGLPLDSMWLPWTINPITSNVSAKAATTAKPAAHCERGSTRRRAQYSRSFLAINAVFPVRHADYPQDDVLDYVVRSTGHQADHAADAIEQSLADISIDDRAG